MTIKDLVKPLHLTYVLGDDWTRGYLLTVCVWDGAQFRLSDGYYNKDNRGRRTLQALHPTHLSAPLHDVAVNIEVTGRKLRYDSPLDGPAVRIKITVPADGELEAESFHGWMEAR